MMESKITLTFKCQVNLNGMPASELGRHCSVCNKTVRDFSPVSNPSKEELKKHECGSFDAVQLQKPFGDRRDILIGYYQKLVQKNSSRKVLLLFVTLLLFISGCRTRLAGAYAYYDDDHKRHNKGTSDSTSVKTPEIK
jgi:hypothetical protein